MIKSTVIKERADQVRTLYSPDLTQTAAELGINIFKFPLNQPDLLGLYMHTMRQRFIYINNVLTASDTRMVIAHEIGHDQLHRELAESGMYKEFSLGQMKNPTEYEANAFAAHLLLPDHDIIQAVADGYTAMQIAMKFSVDQNLLMIKIKEMQHLGISISLPAEPNSLFFREKQAEYNSNHLF